MLFCEQAFCLVFQVMKDRESPDMAVDKLQQWINYSNAAEELKEIRLEVLNTASVKEVQDTRRYRNQDLEITLMRTLIRSSPHLQPLTTTVNFISGRHRQPGIENLFLFMPEGV